MADAQYPPQAPRSALQSARWLPCAHAVLALIVSLLVACSSGPQPASHPAHAATSVAATATPGALAPAGTVAYAAIGQIFVTRPGSPPRQLTHFASPDRAPTHWGPIVWAPDAAHLAVAVGNPVVDANQVAGASGQLYVVSLQNGTLALVTPQTSADKGVAIGPNTYTWQNATRLLFAAGGRIFSYTLATGAAAPVDGPTSTTVLDLAVHRNALYYASYAAPDGPLTALPAVLRRFDLLTHADVQVADLGTVLMQVTGCNVTGCMAAAGIAATLPAWDVSADETALAYARVTSLSPDRTRAHLAFAFAATPATPAAASPTATAQPRFGAPTAIFAGVSTETVAGIPNACCFLRFSPDGRALALTSGYAMTAAFGPYVLYPRLPHATYQAGYPWAFGPAAWQPDSRAFTLTTHRGAAPSTLLLTYGDGATTELVSDAYTCAYALPAG